MSPMIGVDDMSPMIGPCVVVRGVYGMTHDDTEPPEKDPVLRKINLYKEGLEKHEQALRALKRYQIRDDYGKRRSLEIDIENYHRKIDELIDQYPELFI